jgi:hypothetical protein
LLTVRTEPDQDAHQHGEYDEAGERDRPERRMLGNLTKISARATDSASSLRYPLAELLLILSRSVTPHAQYRWQARTTMRTICNAPNRL